MAYIFGSWKLGWCELDAKLFVWQEVYETLLYLLAPFMLPISLIVRPAFCGYLTLATSALYFINVTIFNEAHLKFAKRSAWIRGSLSLLYAVPGGIHSDKYCIVLLLLVKVCHLLQQKASEDYRG
ncbi:hypothetical protein LTR91_024574 [Friedmanniomyces endolithicus]|uniref:Uncharacterized protein n=1 Tax=Friedmanniomyces endolithicus TaxID=329885 RepID=A0AAN6H6R7_9PEZI|nr:hypothetical protein LTR57_024740 [Friedmanniomyces endolithicus]KAK0952145.1 hypothetical protein LTR91_024574 [Friedmanniomyces endolithicus]KAK0952782.1 hypothetical protein LTS01_024682 [Friedmanniomyces endolithicus]